MYQSKSGMIFSDCIDCGKDLNEMEQQFCDDKYIETDFFYPICGDCLNKNYDGEFPVTSKR